jgi:DNA-binding transcriptional regulator YdaS (Cro superfamily)
LTPAQIKALCHAAGGQRAAARLLEVDERNVRRWCAGEARAPHAACELLLLAASGRWPDLPPEALVLPPGYALGANTGDMEEPDYPALLTLPDGSQERQQGHWHAATVAWQQYNKRLNWPAARAAAVGVRLPPGDDPPLGG